MNNKISEKSVFLIDGSSFLYRAYYGLKPLHTSKGETVQAVYGFCRMIKKLVDTYGISHVVLVWDSKGPTARQKIYAQYKATRQAAPNDLFVQKEYIQTFAKLIGMVQISQDGVEADDLMYSLAKQMNGLDFQVVIVSSDKDMRQALCEQILILDPFKDVLMDVASCTQRYGFAPTKLPFYFALVGDSSDNIPGVAGIGPKGATALVQQFASLQDMYDNIASVPKERTRQLLLANKENAFLSQQLFLLQTYPIAIKIEDTLFAKQNWIQALPLFQELEFKSLIAEIEKEHGVKAPAVSDKPAIALDQIYQFVLIDTLQKLIELCAQLSKVAVFAVDTETTGLDPMSATLVGISICYQEGIAYYIPFGHQTLQQGNLFDAATNTLQLDKASVFKQLKPIFENDTITKIFHNAQFDQLVLLQAGLSVKGPIFDTLIAASLLCKEWEKKGLKALSKLLFDQDMIDYAAVVKKHGAFDFSYVPLDAATIYAAADAHQTYKLFIVFEQDLKKNDLQTLFYTIEMPTHAVLLAMRLEGICCDAQMLATFGVKINAILEKIEEDIFAHVGQRINLNSPKQVKELLFDQLQLTPQHKSSKGSYSTDAQALAKLAHEHVIPGMILKYRELFKLKSTYIDALPTYINQNTGKIHTSWNQTLVATGRLSSSDPNLQNIPKDDYGYDVDIRAAFLAEPGWSFIAADYSQIELRILAHFSQDPSLLEAFLSGQDIHAQTAAALFDVDQEQVTLEQRNVGKRINFSVLYGLTPYGLSRDLHISYQEAKGYIDRYFKQYAGVKVWMDQVLVATKEHGYTQTLFGRRRFIPGIYEKNKTLYELASRMAINTPAQGTAAEITKMGMLAFQKALEHNRLQGKIVLQIHDELIITCPDDEIVQTQQLLKSSLESVVTFKIPLIVCTKIGKNWRDVTK